MKILIVEDDEFYAETLKYKISLDEDNEVVTASTGNEAKELLNKTKVDLITLDYSLPDYEGGILLKKLSVLCPMSKIVVISGQDDLKIALKMMREGAYDYLVKDDDTLDRIEKILIHIKKEKALLNEVRHLKRGSYQGKDFRKEIIGDSFAMLPVFDGVETAIKSNGNVTINGKRGTGKRFIARMIHLYGTHNNQPFVQINIKGFTTDEIRKDLFGSEENGVQKKGKLSKSNNGVLFLSDICYLEEELQNQLYNILSEGKYFCPIQKKSIDFNARLICSTSQNLMELVDKGAFRIDLFYRIKGVAIDIPELNKRESDIIILSQYFIQEYCHTHQIEEKKLTKSAKERLMKHCYFDNVKELKYLIEEAIKASGEEIEIQANDIVFKSSGSISTLVKQNKDLGEWMKWIVSLLLPQHNNDLVEIAKVLKVDVEQLRELTKEKQNES